MQAEVFIISFYVQFHIGCNLCHVTAQQMEENLNSEHIIV